MTLLSLTPTVKKREEKKHMLLQCNIGTCTEDQKLAHTQVHLLTSCLLIQNTFLTSFSKIRFENLHISFLCIYMYV